MANETKYFKTPFAESGTRTEVPNTSVGGAVGFDTGFGSDYELPQGSAGRKRIERDKYNGLHHSITKNLKQWQENLYPTWVEDAGTGTPFSYPAGMIVSYNDVNYVSNEAANQEEPGSGSKWSVKSSSNNITLGDSLDIPSLSGKVVEDQAIYWQGYYSPSDGGSNWGLVKFGAHTADGGSIFTIDANTYIKSNLKGARINVRKFGAKGDGSTVDTIAIKNTILNGLARIPSGDFIVDETIVIPNGYAIVGYGYGSKITKTGNDIGDSLVDAVLAVKDEVFTGAFVQVKGLYLDSLNRSDFSLWVGKLSQSEFKNLLLYNTEIGFHGDDVWLTKFSNVISRDLATITTTSKGFEVETGTSNNFNGCWSKSKSKGYDLGLLWYSNLTACGCDSFTEYAYYGGIATTYNSCGAESGSLKVGGFVWGSDKSHPSFDGASITINSPNAASIQTFAANNTVSIFRFFTNQNVVINNAQVQCNQNPGGGSPFNNVDGFIIGGSTDVINNNPTMKNIRDYVNADGSSRVQTNSPGKIEVSSGVMDFNAMPTVNGSLLLRRTDNARGVALQFAGGVAIQHIDFSIAGASATAFSTFGMAGFTTASGPVIDFPLTFTSLDSVDGNFIPVNDGVICLTARTKTYSNNSSVTAGFSPITHVSTGANALRFVGIAVGTI